MESLKRQQLPRSSSWDRKDFWMKDTDCKLCYECQQPFSTLKRRHHCRICGQIFCSRCSQNSVKLEDNKAIRVCNRCYAGTVAKPSPTRSSSIASPTSPRKVVEQEDFLSRSNKPIQIGTLRKYSKTKLKSKAAEISLAFNQNKNAKHQERNGLASSPSEGSASTSPDGGNIFSQVDGEIDDTKNSIDEQVSLQQPRQLRKVPTLPVLQIGGLSKSISEAGLNVSPTKPTVNIATSDEDQKQEDLHRNALAQSSLKHLHQFVMQLLREAGLDFKWNDIILRLVQQICDCFKPDIKGHADKMDIREYTKIKIIPDGMPEDCKYVQGVAFRKNLLHKKMSSRIFRPSILLFNCAIEFQRNRLLLLDDVLAQERSHLKNLIARVAALKPDLILVSKSVSRLAQEFLLEAKISVAQNVKPKVLRRVARAVGSGIVTSPTDVLYPVLGSAKEFYVRTFKGDFGIKPYITLEGDTSALGCTIFLRGGSTEELRKVKQVLLFSTYFARNLQLEQRFLYDQFCKVSPEKLPDQAGSQLLTCSFSVKFPTVKPPSDMFPFYQPTTMDFTAENPFALKAEPQFKTVIPVAAGQDDPEPPNGDTESFFYLDQSPPFGAKEHQRFLYMRSTCCRTNQQQCVPYRLHWIDYYSDNDITLGQFLERNCFDPGFLCGASGCQYRMTEHDRSFIHGNGRLTLSIYKQDVTEPNTAKNSVTMRIYCKQCKTLSSPLPVSEESWNYSFGKFLELSFLDDSLIGRSEGCSHSIHHDHIRYFFSNGMVAQFDYEEIGVHALVLPAEGALSDQLAEFEDEDNVTVMISAVREFYDALVDKLQFLESEQRALKEFAPLLQKANTEHNQITKELSSMQGSDVSLIKLNTLKKQTYAHAVSWCAIVNEQMQSMRRRRSASTAIRPSSKDNADMEGVVPSGTDSNPSSSKTPRRTHRRTASSVETSPVLESRNPMSNSTNSLRAPGSKDKTPTPEIETPKPTYVAAIRAVSQYLSSSSFTTPAPILLMPGIKNMVVVIHEDEPSSLIAHMLSSGEFVEQFGYVVKAAQETYALENKTQIDVTTREDLMKAQLLSREKSDIKCTFKCDTSNGKTFLSCTAYSSNQFYALRSFYCRSEDDFIRSLSRCKSWEASGGKSGSTFSKTLDDRFILKKISQIELDSFLEVAPLYFEYLRNTLFQQVSSVLAKIYGVYTLRSECQNGHRDVKHIVVMENLFYKTDMTQIYDLKGSKRNRYITEGSVLLDENLLEVMYTSPLWLDGPSKTALQAALWNDSLFLSSLGVMDYSLVVGITKSNQIVVGIIDYIRKYTWDKQLETWVKTVSSRAVPTVISPRQYKIRFREAMSFYFVHVPNKLTNVKNMRRRRDPIDSPKT